MTFISNRDSSLDFYPASNCNGEMHKWLCTYSLLLLALLWSFNGYAQDANSLNAAGIAQTGLAKDPVAIPPPANLVPLSLIQMGDGSYFSKHALLVDKKLRTLSLWENDKGIPKLVKF